jgi:SAM-dependent methyltransferase
MRGRRGDDYELDELSNWHYSLGWGEGVHSVAPFVPSPENVIHNMLKLSHAGPGDTLFDLGCGDGRILFIAVEKFDVDRAIGVELNPNMVKGINEKIKEKGLEKRIQVHNGNFFNVDISPATVVTLYLTTSGNTKLRPKFTEELKPGTMIVSHDFPIQEWDEFQSGSSPHSMGSHKIYVYNVSEDMGKSQGWGVLKDKRWRTIRDRLIRI